MVNFVKDFAGDERASVTMGYGLVAVGLSLAILTLLQGIGIRLATGSAPADGGPR